MEWSFPPNFSPIICFFASSLLVLGEREQSTAVMGSDRAALPQPCESFTLLCVRCGSSLYYVRPDRARGVFEHRFDCRRCGPELTLK